MIINLKRGFCNLLIKMSNDFKEQVGWLDWFFLAFEEYTNVLSWMNWRLSTYHALLTSCLWSRNPPSYHAYQGESSSFNKCVQSTSSESGSVLWPKAGGGPAPVSLAHTGNFYHGTRAQKPSNVHGRNFQYSGISHSCRGVHLLNSRPCEYFWPMDINRNTLHPSCTEAVKSWFSRQSIGSLSACVEQTSPDSRSSHKWY